MRISEKLHRKCLKKQNLGTVKVRTMPWGRFCQENGELPGKKVLKDGFLEVRPKEAGTRAEVTEGDMQLQKPRSHAAPFQGSLERHLQGRGVWGRRGRCQLTAPSSKTQSVLEIYYDSIKKSKPWVWEWAQPLFSLLFLEQNCPFSPQASCLSGLGHIWPHTPPLPSALRMLVALPFRALASLPVKGRTEPPDLLLNLTGCLSGW